MKIRKRGEATEGVMVADGIVPKRGEVVVVAVEAVRNGDEVVVAAGGVEEKLMGKEKEGVEDPNPREAGGAEEIVFAASLLMIIWSKSYDYMAMFKLLYLRL